jgi:hypothetical protein
MQSADLPCVGVSAKTGEGLENLRKAVMDLLALGVGPDEMEQRWCASKSTVSVIHGPAQSN